MILGPARPPRTACEADGCNRSTKEGKPFCSDHILHQPYVQELLAALEAKEAEEARVTRLGARAVDPEGITAREVVRTLTVHGPRTLPRLAKDMNLEVETLDGYVKALRKLKEIRIRKNNRGTAVIELRAA